ncbi:MAG: type II toxin-antitoxin system RelB/DinJ family antitoxin [Patescibacteria group bacterium]
MDDRSFKKTDNIQVRIQKPLKDRVESILSELGVTTSQAITIFFKQIVDKNGIPFNLSLSYDPVPLSDEEIKSIKEGKAEKGIIVDTKNEGKLERYLNKIVK